jgi:predicted aspartyl protease
MKFPKPKNLVSNDYPDIDITQPELLRQFVQNYVHPKENSYMVKYYSRTIEVLKEAKSVKAKEKARQKAANNSVTLLNTQNISVNSTQSNIAKLGHELFFIVCRIRNKENKRYMPFKALADTGASNSLLHTSVAKRLGISYKPMKLILATATGLDDTAVKGIAHQV